MRFVIESFAAVLTATVLLLVSTTADASALNDYVFKPDPVYNYSFSGIVRQGKGWDAYMYTMTSQSWLTEADVDRNIWTHQLALIVPKVLNTSLGSAVIYITGGDNQHMDKFPKADDEGMVVAAALAVNAKSIGAVLWQVPNQPLKFPCDPIHQPPEARVEDQVISLTFWHYTFVNNSDPTWLAYFPMVKSAVRALDTLTAIIPAHSNYTAANSPAKFIVAGASKRGWTTWLTGAVDKRVIGIIPIVLSALHLRDFGHRQYQFYGNWTFALINYWHMNFTTSWDLPQMQNLYDLIDPWYLRDKLTMPKLAINAVGDEFQMPDDQRYWAHDMPGEMNLLMLQNADHTCATGVLEIIESGSSFIQAVQQNYTRPNYTWAIDEATGNITVTSTIKPKEIIVWYGESALGVSQGRRDFRWGAINATKYGNCKHKIFGACERPIFWAPYLSGAREIAPLTYQVGMQPVAGRWLGFLMEVHWHNPLGDNDDFVFTSPVSVIPNTKPFADCHGEACKGGLV